MEQHRTVNFEHRLRQIGKILKKNPQSTDLRVRLLDDLIQKLSANSITSSNTGLKLYIKMWKLQEKLLSVYKEVVDIIELPSIKKSKKIIDRLKLEDAKYKQRHDFLGQFMGSIISKYMFTEQNSVEVSDVDIDIMNMYITEISETIKWLSSIRDNQSMDINTDTVQKRSRNLSKRITNEEWENDNTEVEITMKPLKTHTPRQQKYLMKVDQKIYDSRNLLQWIKSGQTTVPHSRNPITTSLRARINKRVQGISNNNNNN